MSKREREHLKCRVHEDACCGNCIHFKNEDVGGIGWCDIRECSAGVGSLCQTWNFRGKELILPLKKKWFEMIKSGEKPEEYREINEYWAKRFCKNRKTMFCWLANGVCDNVCFNSREFEWDCVTFTCGYPRKDDTERRITFKNPSIIIGEGREEWGAEKGKIYFVITWKK